MNGDEKLDKYREGIRKQKAFYSGRIGAIIPPEDETLYKVVFYEDKGGYSELYEELLRLKQCAPTSKDARIQFKQIVFYIELLKKNGTRLSNEEVKHIQGDIWELRPDDNRILYFYFKDRTFVLLHMFRKKTMKTPRKEIEKALREMEDHLKRNGGK